MLDMCKEELMVCEKNVSKYADIPTKIIISIENIRRMYS